MKKLFSIFFTVIFFVTPSIGWSLTMDDLVERNGIYYKKFINVPFTGRINGNEYLGKIETHKKVLGLIKNGKKEGTWLTYYSNGNLYLNDKYKNGKLDGICENYWENGNLQMKIEYKNGKAEGFVIGYWENGDVWEKGHYKNDTKEGYWISFNDLDGSVWKKYTGTYKDGRKISD